MLHLTYQSQRVQLTLNQMPIIMNENLHHAISDLARKANSPIELAAASMLSAMAFASQHHVDVTLPYGKTVPTSLFTLTIAPSGSGKSSVMDLSWQAPTDLMKSLAPDAQTINEYKSHNDWWQTRHNQLKKDAAKAENPKDHRLENLLKHLALKPIQPKAPTWLFDDTTPEAILNSMARNWSSVALASAEGGTILQGHALKHLPQFNQLWSGETLRIDRRTQEPLIIDQGRLSMAIMTQPNSFNTFLRNKRELARSSGFLARTLTCRVESTSPQRDTSTDHPYALNWFNHHMNHLLKTAFEKPVTTRKPLSFDDNAKTLWYDYIGHIKLHAGNKANPLHELGDFVAKIPEQIGRIAAVITCFESNNTAHLIDGQAMKTAIDFMNFYVQEAIRIYHPQADEIADGQLLLEWFNKEIAKINQGSHSRVFLNNGVPPSITHPFFVYTISKTNLYHFAPNPLRNKRRLDAAIALLEEHNNVTIGLDANRAQFINYLVPHTYVQNITRAIY